MTAIATPHASLAKHIAFTQSQDQDWEHAALARELHRWSSIFQAEWKLDLPHDPVLHFERIRNAYATYMFGKTDIGTPDNITFNTAALDRPAAHIIRTLGHELLHFWQRYHGKPTSRRGGHNDEYVKKAASVGILIDASGCTSGHTEAFSALVNRHGINLPDGREEPGGLLILPTGGVEPKLYGTRGANGGGSKMKKWTCECCTIRAAVDLRVLCRKCGKTFKRAE